MKFKGESKREFERLPEELVHIADADTVIGTPIVTVSGAQVIPLTSVTVVTLGGGGEYGDVKTFRVAEGFKLAGGNGSVVTIKPRGFLIDDGKICRLLRIEESTIDAIIEKTGDIVQSIQQND